MRALPLALLVAACASDAPQTRPPADVIGQLFAATDSTVPIAERTELPFEHLRAAFDADNDWRITRAEMPHRDWVRFERTGDDELSLDDFPTESGALLESVERALDARIVQGALPEVLPDLDAFMARDTDHNGAIDRAEFERAEPRTPGTRDAFSAALALAQSWSDDALDLDEWRFVRDTFVRDASLQ